MFSAAGAAAGRGAGARRGAGRRAAFRGDARRALRLAARRAVLRDPPFLFDAFLLPALRDFAFIFAFVRFFAMRAPSK
jgi:hypothetical protein